MMKIVTFLHQGIKAQTRIDWIKVARVQIYQRQKYCQDMNIGQKYLPIQQCISPLFLTRALVALRELHPYTL